MTETFSHDGHDTVIFPLSFRTRMMLLFAVISPRGWMKLHIHYTRTLTFVPAEEGVRQPENDLNRRDNSVFYRRAVRCALWILLCTFALAGSTAHAVFVAVSIALTYYEKDESIILEIGNPKKTNA